MVEPSAQRWWSRQPSDGGAVSPAMVEPSVEIGELVVVIGGSLECGADT